MRQEAAVLHHHLEEQRVRTHGGPSHTPLILRRVLSDLLLCRGLAVERQILSARLPSGSWNADLRGSPPRIRALSGAARLQHRPWGLPHKGVKGFLLLFRKAEPRQVRSEEQRGARTSSRAPSCSWRTSYRLRAFP